MESPNSTTDSVAFKLLRLRLLVGYLGERAQFGWWPTAFFEPSSRAFLEPVFSRTSQLARYHGVVDAARRLHDEQLNVGSYHLFRMPEEVEQDIHALAQGAAASDFISETLRSKDDALGALTPLAGKSGRSGEGPMAVGKIEELDSLGPIGAMASAYVQSFSSNLRVYPYLSRKV